jgi:large subunit ribosomal protein L36
MLGGVMTPEQEAAADRNTRPPGAVRARKEIARNAEKEDETMKVRTSLRSLKGKAGSTVVRRHGRTRILNPRHPRWKARQG